MSKFNPLKNIGPGTLVAAAFIGPGSVTVCSKAGANFGFTLLWALLLSIIATFVLQEMAARLGLIGKMGLAEAVRTQIKSKWLRIGAVLLMISAIIIGNSAYQAGNIAGGVIGLTRILPDLTLSFSVFEVKIWPILLGGIAFILLYIGNYKIIEKLLVSLVVLMSLSFIIAALMTTPNWANVFSGTFIPTLPSGSVLTVIGVIGTTVVPYNLFLHASLVQEKWQDEKDLKTVRRDAFISIGLGGLVSMSILIAAAAIHGGTIENAGDLAKGLQPLFGDWAAYFLGIGLFAAGITSAITAPLAAAYVAQGCFGWSKELKAAPFRRVWAVVLLIGVSFAAIGKKPLEIIDFAQIANGLLLPIIALFLIWVVNKKKLMGKYTNSLFQNVMATVIILMVLALATKMIYSVF